MLLRVVVAALMAVGAQAAAPNWVKITDGETASSYLDSATIRRNGRKATMWELTDYRAAPDAQHPYLSVKRQYEFDCDEQALRTLSIANHAGHMGGGRVVLAINEPTKWLILTPGSVGDVLWQTACGRRFAPAGVRK